jgi:hypothetical protein
MVGPRVSLGPQEAEVDLAGVVVDGDLAVEHRALAVEVGREDAGGRCNFARSRLDSVSIVSQYPNKCSMSSGSLAASPCERLRCGFVVLEVRGGGAGSGSRTGGDSRRPQGHPARRAELGPVRVRWLLAGGTDAGRAGTGRVAAGQRDVGPGLDGVGPGVARRSDPGRIVGSDRRYARRRCGGCCRAGRRAGAARAHLRSRGRGPRRAIGVDRRVRPGRAWSGPRSPDAAAAGPPAGGASAEPRRGSGRRRPVAGRRP